MIHSPLRPRIVGLTRAKQLMQRLRFSRDGEAMAMVLLVAVMVNEWLMNLVGGLIHILNYLLVFGIVGLIPKC